MFFCSTCPLAILHQSCSSQAPCGAQKGGAADRCREHLLQSWLQEPTDGADPCLRSSMQTFVMLLNLSHTYFRHLEDIAVMLSVTFTSSGPLQNARSRTPGAARRTRSGVGSLQFWCPSSSTGGRLPEVPSHRMQLLHRGYLDELISKF